MTAVDEILDLALAQTGDRYVLGAEVSATAADSDRWDCSELVEWACGRAGVTPRMPDGSHWQFRHCQNHGTLIPVAEAVATRGALLFVERGAAAGGGRGNHVALSLGDGRTIEARGTRYGVGSWTAHGRSWTHGALIPGASYDPPGPPPPTSPGGDMLVSYSHDDGQPVELPVDFMLRRPSGALWGAARDGHGLYAWEGADPEATRGDAAWRVAFHDTPGHTLVGLKAKPTHPDVVPDPGPYGVVLVRDDGAEYSWIQRTAAPSTQADRYAAVLRSIERTAGEALGVTAALALTGSEDAILRLGAVALTLAAIAAFFLGAVRLLRFLARWTVVGEEVLRHFTPDEHGQSLPGNVAQLTKSSEATAANLRLIAHAVRETERDVARLGHDVGEVDRKVENLHGRVVSIERWKDRHDPDGVAAHHRRTT